MPPASFYHRSLLVRGVKGLSCNQSLIIISGNSSRPRDLTGRTGGLSCRLGDDDSGVVTSISWSFYLEKCCKSNHRSGAVKPCQPGRPNVTSCEVLESDELSWQSSERVTAHNIPSSPACNIFPIFV